MLSSISSISSFLTPPLDIFSITSESSIDETDDEEDDRDDIERDPEGMDEDERQSRVNEEEGAAWMVEQGFDHKE